MSENDGGRTRVSGPALVDELVDSIVKEFHNIASVQIEFCMEVEAQVAPLCHQNSPFHIHFGPVEVVLHVWSCSKNIDIFPEFFKCICKDSSILIAMLGREDWILGESTNLQLEKAFELPLELDRRFQRL
ncbi:hypothetical protein FGSG_12013 [Fusarium graminearum PH-1]|uniref:hypothetical protein n=1 Tax=Gibberella zeae (strain ATCC MYA-4620 / CBS 123657 / FGSC 9075 / NRRL 31084 / PH-1) TaxID=229533 RepID=UPI00021F133D|nr:hypothetical protein FGSG_12013 [Fusarium graminearum PH-1]ESU07159.1 hypothetical protein FGSG_12013 [Fusarium graminearum PH-1]|eukprot:XP_011317644.1 hypothetical protein FGSG_12013 [Fusarium graminearum PH-1]